MRSIFAMATSPMATRAFRSALALVLAVIGAASFLYYHQGLFMPRVVAVRVARGLGNGYSFGNDFYQVWLTSQELLRHHRDPYSVEMTREIQVGLYGRPLDASRPGDPVDRRVFPYPAFAELLFWPAAEISFPPVRVGVLCLLIVATCASVLFWLRAFDWQPGWIWTVVLILLVLCSYPALEGLFAGQLGLLVAFLLAASMLALRRQKFLLAGVLMAITTIKPQMTALAILYLLFWTWTRWRDRKFFGVGLFSTLALLLAGSVAVLPNWIQNWVHTILAYRHYTRPPLVTEVLTSSLGPTLSEPVTLALTAASVIGAVILSWRNRDAEFGSFRFWLTLSLLLSITAVVLLPGQAVYDHLILLPGILFLVRYRDRLRHAGLASRILVGVGAVFLFWPWITAFALIVLRPIVSPSVFDSTAIFAIPIRNAASLPFAVLALLAWLGRVTVVHPQELS
jgi:Glycosyltransferase family 87